MSRDAGFATADVDTGLFADPKIVALARRLRDPGATAAHTTIYVALILESWAAGERVTIEEAAPAWWLVDLADVASNLRAVGLLDDEDRIPEHAWNSWFLPAFDRREERRASGRKGGLAKARNQSPSGAIAEPERSSTRPYRSVPTDPSVPPVERHDGPKNGTTTDLTTCPKCGDLVQEADPNVVVLTRRGGLGHRDCPAVVMEMEQMMKAAHAQAVA